MNLELLKEKNLLMYEDAVETGAKNLDNMMQVLARAQEEIQRYKEQYEKEESAESKAKILSWAVNYMASNILGNARFDILVSIAAELMKYNISTKE